MPLFTIATVTLNNLNGLKRTQTSVQAQTCTNYEWLVQDGASNDSTLEFLKTTNAQTQSQKDDGIYHAMNRLIERATGDYIIFMNAGDTLADPGTLKTLKENITDQDFIYGDALEDDRLKKSRPLKNHLATAKYGMFTHHQAMLYNRKSLGKLRYNQTYKIAADYDFTCRFLLSLKHHPRDNAQHCSNSGDPESALQRNSRKTLYIPQVLCTFESGGISQQKSTLGRAEQFQIRKDLNLCSPLENHLITAAQFLNLKLRKFFPNLYWNIKNHR